MSQQIDGIDQSIIGLLEQNGRTSNREIARILGVSEGTVRARIRRLQDDKLLRIIAVRNLNHGGWALAHLGILAHPDKLRSAAQAIADMPECVFAAIAIGHYDIVAMVVAESRAGLIEIVNDHIARLPGVQRVEATETIGSAKFLPNLRKMR